MIGGVRGVAGNIADDQPRETGAEPSAADAKSVRSPGCQVLNENVGTCEKGLDQRQVIRVLQIDDARFLAAVIPYEIARLAMNVVVVAAGEISFRSLQLDNPRAGIRQA